MNISHEGTKPQRDKEAVASIIVEKRGEKEDNQLELADLVARPVGIKVLRPDQPNRAYDILEKKLRRNQDGETKGWGLKVFP